MRFRRIAAALTLGVLAAAIPSFTGCSSSGDLPLAPQENVGRASNAVFTNGGFESGTAGAVPPAPWSLGDFVNVNGVTIQSPQTYAGLNLASHGAACTTNTQCTGTTPQQGTTCSGGFCQPASKTITLNSATGAGTQIDPTLGATATLRWPRYGNQCALVNQLGNHVNVNQLSQTMTVGAGDVDPTDGKVHVRLVVAPVLEDPGHPASQQPYFFVQVTNVTQGNAVLYSNFNFSNQSGVPWKSVITTSTYRYTDWQLIDVAPGSPAINMGDQIQLTLVAAGCSLGAHMGELYVDGVGSTIPGLYLSGTGPTQANPGTNVTYTLTYKNGSPVQACTTSANCAPATEACVGGVCAETGATIDFTTPPGTTFQSFTAPAGATCTTPAVGTAGTIVCTLTNPVAPGTSGAFTVTVAVSPTTTGDLVCGNYGIASTQESHLLGNKIDTMIGCTTDADCATGNWCNETTSTCTPKLANGTAMPSDPAHTNPTLNGTCTAAAGTLVCTSAVCDTADGKCGYANGDGTCSAANASTVCRSGVCDPDTKCGYALNDGPCTAASAATVCRSGACSTNGLCEPAGGCNVDADCAAGNWCMESTHTCTPKLANGAVIPNDPPHVSPTLNGTCTSSAGALVCTAGACDTTDDRCGLLNGDGPCTLANGATVCRSAVCDPDLKCGYAVGDGPCTAANATTVCRSGTCSSNGLCEPAGGCNVDADCAAGNWCNESAHTCTPKLANGAAVPSDPPHANPTLNGTCTAAAGALVCTAAVCDTADDACGYANGDGPCTSATGATVCRSGACSTNGLCEPAGGCNVDADCTAGNWCNETTHACTAKLANGTAMPNDPPHTNPTLDGTCTPAAGALVCTSAVCDPDATCGYANGDGPCTTATGATVCRSGACSTNGLCEPAGGCNVDADCATGNWCNETSHACTPKLANGAAMPTDAPHTNPTLNGKCTPAAGVLVCAAGLCETSDDHCGLLNGDGPCTAANGTTVCRSGVCDSDLKCGYAVGDGPCTAADAATVCRSGACSSNGLCQPAGGCNIDADCTSGNWCNESTHACTPKLSNGTAMPTDAPHANPTLDGTCTAAAGALVCTSGVCDTDAKCGYANGDGPCTAADGATICRSGACSTNGTCEPAGGCNVDADCATGNWCNETTHACTPKLANGAAMPTDAPHASPTLNGKCTTDAAALVCQSGTCDAKDDACGYANGDGPCTATNGGSVCRSTVCATTGANAGLCVACVDDSKCASPTPACDVATNACVTCVPGDATLCTGATPVCDATSKSCAACNGDNGGAATDACPDTASPFCTSTGACAKCTSNADCATGTHGGPLCDPTTGVCGTTCKSDGDCSATQWCDDLASPAVCTPKVDNGQPVPGGTCTSALGARACVSGSCDTKDGKCGFANGDGPCTSTNGANVCRSKICVTTGANAGLCEACADSSTCSATTPVCDASASACVACNGDEGTSATDACPTSGQPFCASSGACGKCTSDADCTTGTHAGTTCDVPSGACVPASQPDAGPDAGNDAGVDAGAEAGADATVDAGTVEGGGCTTSGGTGAKGGLALVALAIASALARRRRTPR